MRRSYNQALLLLTFFFILFIIFGYRYYLSEEKRELEIKEQEISSVSKFKVSQLVDRQRLRLLDAKTISNSEPFRSLIIRSLSPTNANHSLLRESLKAFVENNLYFNIYLIDNQGNISFKNYLDSASQIELDDFHMAELMRVLERGGDYTSILLPIGAPEKALYCFFSPIMDDQNEVIANLLFVIDVKRNLKSLMRQWAFVEGGANNLIILDNGDTIQVDEATGPVQSDRTLNRETPIMNSNWILVEKINLEELYIEVKNRFLTLFFVGLSAYLLSIMLLYLFHLVKKRDLDRAIGDLMDDEEQYRQLMVQLRMELLSYAANNSLKDTLKKMLDRVGEITESPLGFVHFIGEDQNRITLSAWSTETEREFAHLIKRYNHKSIDEAGAWADVLIDKKGVIHNDFELVPNKKGFPEGHPKLFREIIIPVYRDGKAVSIQGIANKRSDYTSRDLYLASYMAEVIWDITEIKLREKKLEESEEKYRSIFYGHSSINLLIDEESGKIIDANSSAVEFYGWSLEELKKMHIADINTLSLAELEKFRTPLLNRERTLFELTQKRADGSLVDVELYTGNIMVAGKNIIYAIVHDVTLKRYKERSQEILYDITKISMGGVFPAQLISIVKVRLSKLLDVSNLYIGLYDKEREMLKKVEFLQSHHSPDNWRSLDTLPGYLFTKKEKLLLSGKELLNFTRKHELAEVNKRVKAWLGVPLVYQGSTTGVLVLESHTNRNAYNRESLILIDMVAHELSTALGRAQLIEDLVEAKEQAEESNRLKTAFLANLSHEIRTPMNSIIGFLELLSTSHLDKEQSEVVIEQVKEGSNRLLETLNHLVEISKADSLEQHSSLYQEINSNQLLKELYSLYKFKIESKGVNFRLTLKIEEYNSTIYSLEGRIRAVLNHLLSNALKYTVVGEIEMGSYRLSSMEREEICFFVKDSGPGIAEDQLSTIFDPFTVTELELSREHQGMGLGLAIAKSYVESLGGVIEVESEVGNYTKFSFTLPITE